MAKYQVVFASSFEADLAKLDKCVQNQIMNWVGKHMVDVAFPTYPGET